MTGNCISYPLSARKITGHCYVKVLFYTAAALDAPLLCTRFPRQEHADHCSFSVGFCDLACLNSTCILLRLSSQFSSSRALTLELALLYFAK